MANKFSMGTEEMESKFNIIRGCIIGSYLSIPDKMNLCDFLSEIEECFNEESEDE